MVSIIVPVLNEEAQLPALLKHLASLPGDAEIVVADGGSEDHTRQIASDAAVVLVDAPRGRGIQIQAAAAAARGDAFIILHADCRLHMNAVADVTRACEEGVYWGWFDISYDTPRCALRFIAWLLNLRSAVFSDATGENAIFASRAAWERIGGCPQTPIMEDLLLCRYLRRIGRGKRLRGPVIASPRRFEVWGVWKMSWRCIGLWMLFQLRVPPHVISRFYPQQREIEDIP